MLNFLFINKKKFSRSLFLTFLFFFFIFILHYFNILHKYLIPPFSVNNEIIFFGDAWRVTTWIECNSKNINILINNNCSDQPLTYGMILKYFPYNFYLDIFYKFIIPILSISLIVFLHFHLNMTRNFLDFILVGLAISNQHTLLMFDRGNTDLLIYLVILLTCLNIKNFEFLKGTLITIFTLLKYYPVLIFQYFLINFSIKKLKLIIFFSIIISSFIFFHLNEIIYIFENNFYGASIRYNYSFFANQKYFQVLHEYSSLGLLISLFLLLIASIISFKLVNLDHLKKINFSTYNSKLFLISLNFIFFIYFLNENYYYKDFYIMLLIPFILDNKFGNIFNKLLIYFITLRYLFIIFSNNFIIWRKNYELLFIQNVFDNILIGLLIPIFLFMNFYVLVSLKKIKNL